MNEPALLKAALWYARHGYSVFPLHTPIFDEAGNYTGCTCEEWKRTQPRYGPEYKCDQPGKCPRVKWHDQSTIDEATIRQWWRWWPDANIGIDAGKSGLLIFDLDSYKEIYEGFALQIDENTITSLTGGGGSHLWYRQPEGKAYGNATGELPAGIDIRGAGGYIVAPPSLHKSGRRYEFVADHSPSCRDPLPLPQFLIAILEAAQASHEAVAVTFSATNAPPPVLSRWELSETILDLIHQGAPKGERSEADYGVILALARAGADDDEIRAVFTHFAIGAKYAERGDRYLALSIGKARAWLLDHPPDVPQPQSIERLAAARQWARGADCIARLRGAGVRRVADHIPILDALLEIAQSKRSTRFVITFRDIADRCAITASSTHRRVAKEEAAGLLTTKADSYGTLIDLSPLVDLSGTPTQNVQSVPLRSTSEEDFFANHRGDDAFTSYPYAYAIKRRQAPTVLMQSLGATGLLLWEALLDGGTVKELAEMTGCTVAAVRATMKRYEQAGLLLKWQVGRAQWVVLHPNADERLDERREHMATYGIGQLRAARNASDKASYAQRKLQSRMPLEPRQKMKLIARRDQADDKAAAHYEALLHMGIDPHAKVQHRQYRPYTLKIDRGEEWVSVHRPIYEQWQELVDVPYQERYRMMAIAGYTRHEIDAARRMAAHVGRGPRQFVGVGNEAVTMAA